MKRRQIYCKHYEEQAKITFVCTYYLIGADLNICAKCEKKLRNQIKRQIKAEKLMRRLIKK